MSRESRLASRAPIVVFALTSLLFAQSSTLPRQNNKTDKSSVDNRARQALRQRVIGQLEQLLVGARAAKDEEIKITVQVQVADLLWESDKPRAARMFEDAFRAIEAIGSSESGDDPAVQAKVIKTQSRLRAELLGLLSKRDAKLAERLVKSISLGEVDLEAERVEISRSDREKAKLYMESAKRLADTNPELAVSLAKTYLDRQPSAEVVNLLFRLQNNNPALADELFQHALSLVERDAAGSFDVRGLAPYVLGNNPGTAVNQGIRNESVRRFLQLAYSYLAQESFGRQAGDNIYASRRAASDYQFARQLLPYFEEHLPGQVETVNAALNHLSARIPPALTRESSPDKKPIADIDSLLSESERTVNPIERDGLYRRAALLAIGSNNTTRALSIAEKISDESMRVSTTSTILFGAAVRAVREKDFTSAYQYLKGLPDLRQRVVIFNQMIRLSNGDRTRALIILSDAEQMLSSAADGPNKVNALLNLQLTADALDSNRGFEIMQSAIRALNRLDESTTDNSAALKPGGETAVNDPMSLTVFDFRGLEIMARQDFDRGLMLAQSIRPGEVTLLAQLAVCRGALISSTELTPGKKDNVKDPVDRKPIGREKPRLELTKSPGKKQN